MAEVIDELIVRISGDASDLESTINSVSGELSKLDRQQNGNNLSKSAGKVAESWQKAGKSIKDFGEGFDKATKPLQNAAVALSVGGVAAAKFAVDFENNFANVKKTVDGTPEQLEKIRQEIIDMSTVGINGHSAIPQTTAELTELAAAGGQLGIETERIAGFTETMAMLGTATNLSGEEGAATLAKFANVTKMSQENFDRLGSSIVDLGNNFATTESDIANMSMRLAGAGTQVGLNQADILGIATALSSVGIEAEMGGSAFSKAMIAMQMASSTGYTQINEVLGKTGMSLRDLQLMSANNSKDFKALADNLGYTSTELTSMMNSGVQLENFAKITGKTTEEFKNLFDSSPAEAIDAFIKGLQNSDSTGESAIEMLQEMGFTEVRLRDSLLRLANSEAGVTEAVTRSNQAWEENTALQNEFNAKAETTASQLAVTKNNFIEAGRSIGETMLPTIKDVSAGIAGFAQKLASMDDSAKKTLVNTASGVIALGIASKGIAGTIKNVGGVVEGIGTMQKALSAGGTLAKFAPALASIGSVVGPAALGVAGITTAVVAGKKAYDAWYDSQYRWSEGLSAGNQKISESLNKYKDISSIQNEIKSLRLTIDNSDSSSEQVDKAKSRLEEIKDLLSREYNLVINSDNSNLDSAVESIKTLSKTQLQINMSSQNTKLVGLKEKFDSFNQADYDNAASEYAKIGELMVKVQEINKKYSGTSTDPEILKKRAEALNELGKAYGYSSEEIAAGALNVSDLSIRYEELDKKLQKLQDQKNSHDEYIAISTELANWNTELLQMSAVASDAEGVSQALSNIGMYVRTAGLDMNGYAQAAAKAMNGIDFETAISQGGEALDNFANDYVRSMKEFGASAEETYTGAALIRQGFHSIAEAAAKGELDNVTAQANELAHKIDAIPADKHIVINASGDISIIEDVQSAVDKVNASGDVQLMVSATGDVSVLETADEKLQELINNNQVTVTFNAQTNGFDISNLQGDKIGQITADGKINWTQGEIEKPKDEKADGTIDYKLGEVAKPENAIAEGTINYKIGRVEKPKPNARGTQNFSGGLALVNDDGHADPRELIIDRGRAFIPEGRDVILPLSKGAKVYTSEQTKAIMSGLGIPRYASGKNNSDAFTTAKDNWSHYTKTHSVTTEQELQKWLEFQEKYKENEKDIWDIEEQIFSIQKKLYSERVSESEKWLKHEEKYNGMSVSDYLAGIDRMKAYTAEYYAQGIINHKEYTDAIADLDEKYLDKRKEQLSELYDFSTAYVSEHSYFNDWDDIGDDPLAAYNRVMDRHKDALANGELTQKEYDDYASKLGSDMLSQRTEQSMNWLEEQRKYFGMSGAEYVEGLERIKAYTQEYYDKGLISRREYNEAMTDLNHSMWDEALDAYDDMLQKQQDYISEMREQFQKEEQALQDSWAVADRKTDMSEVQAQLDIYSGAVTDRGQQKYKELQEQMKQLQRDEELYNLQVRNNATLEGLEADYKTLEENKKTLLNELRATDMDISDYVDSISTSISNSGANIESLLGELLSAFKGFKVEAPSTTYADNRVVNLSAMPLSEFAANYMGGINL